mgnify:CR=1 FL=1
MLNGDPTRTIFATAILVFLGILAIFILKPIIISIIIAFLLAFIFSPVYDWLHRKTKSKNLSATIVIIFLMAIIILPLWFFTPILIKQSFGFFESVNKADFTNVLKSIFPDLFASQQFATEIGIITSSFTSRIAGAMTNAFANIILNFPEIAMQLMVLFFTFFFVLRDKDIFISYVRNILPFQKDVEEKLFRYTRDVTSSILYGHVVIGVLQGLILGISFFIFGIPKALLLTSIAVIVGIVPIVGPFLVWLPVAIYIFLTHGATFSFFGILFFGLIASSIDNYLMPLIVSRKTQIHSGILLISMVGGLFFFGVLGFLLGPLVISYLLIFLEIYRGKSRPSILVEESSK